MLASHDTLTEALAAEMTVRLAVLVSLERLQGSDDGDWWDWAPIARRFHSAAVARLREEVTRGPS